MNSTEVYLGLLCAAGLIASFLALRVENLARKRWFQVTGLLVFLVGLALMWRSLTPRVAVGGEAAASDMIVTIVGVLFVAGSWMMFFAVSVAGAIANIVRSLISLDDIRIPPPFSRVDAAIARRDLPEALNLLKEVAAEYPSEPEPQRRLGELYLMMDRPDSAIAAYREAERLEPEARQKLLYVFSVSEIHAEKKRDPEAAIGTIEEFLVRFPDVPGRAFAEERIARLRTSLAGGGGRAQ